MIGINFKQMSRSHVLLFVLLCTMVLIVIRLFYLQIIRHDYYKKLARQEQVKSHIIPAERGRIYAMDGNNPVELVMNQQVYTVFADPTVVNKPREIEETIRSIAGGEIVKGDIQELLKDKKSQYKVLARGISLRQAELIKNKKFKGVGFQKNSRRTYPEGSLAAQTLGFVNNENKGQYGIEEMLDSRLRGKDGLLKSVTDVANVPLSIGNENIRQNPVHGDSIVLTLDRNIQSKAEEVLSEGLRRTGASNGSVLVMNPKNGHVLAMANLPTYNPAEFTKVQNPAAFVNGVTMLPYEPGSVLKTFTIATGIDKKVIDAQSTYYNTDRIKVEDRTISNALKGLTGTISMQTALNNSLNTGMVTIAQRLGDGHNINRQARDTLYDYFHNRFGLGELTGIEVAGESKGTVVSPSDKNNQGNAVRYSNMSFGQGLDVTMIQVAAGFSAIINGGTYYQPTVVAGTYGRDGIKLDNSKKVKSNVISQSASAQTREMIHNARTQYTKDDTPGYYIGGKTGTSQTIGASGQYIDSQTIGTYLGFGGTDSDTKYVIMVQVSGKNMNLEGNKHAMPIFTELSNWLIEYYQLQPRK